MIEDGFDNGVGIGSRNGSLISEADAVAEDFFRDAFDVLGNGVIPAGKGGDGFRGANESDGSPRRSAVGDHVGESFHRIGRGVPGRRDDIGDVRVEFFIDVHSVAHGGTKFREGLFSENFGNGGHLRRRHPPHDFDFFGFGRIIDFYLEKEAVEGRFGQRIGPLFFEGVHGRDHEKRRRKREGFARDGYPAFLHGLKKGRLHFRRGAVNFVGNDDVGEDRSFLYREFAGLGAVRLGSDDVGRKEVRRELDSYRFQIEGLGEGFGHQSLSESGNAFQKDMPVGNEADEQALQKLVLPDDDFGNLKRERIVSVFYGRNRHVRFSLETNSGEYTRNRNADKGNRDYGVPRCSATKASMAA